MEYKHILKEYKKHTRERIKRCETLFKAFKELPDPTAEEERDTYRRVAQKARRLIKEPFPAFRLECLLDYVQHKLEETEEQQCTKTNN
jgi:hypothetical protein